MGGLVGDAVASFGVGCNDSLGDCVGWTDTEGGLLGWKLGTSLDVGLTLGCDDGAPDADGFIEGRKEGAFE